MNGPRDAALADTIPAPADDVADHRRDEGDDALGEEWAERDAEWRDGPGGGW